mgnify:FL=1
MKKILLTLCILSIPLLAQSVDEKEVLKNIGKSKQVERDINIVPQLNKRKKMGREIASAPSIIINKRTSI